MSNSPESESSAEHRNPDPKLLELLKSGGLTPLFRTYGKDELSPDINVIASYDSDPNSLDVVREVKILSFPLDELNLAQDFLKAEALSGAARLVVERFFRGLTATPTVRHMSSIDQF